MESGSQNPTLGEAATLFLSSLASGKKDSGQQEVYKFVRWYGWERPFAGLTAPEAANYAERLPSSDADCNKKLEMVRAFLVYARKEGWTKGNLAAHLKTKKAKTRLRTVGRQGLPGTVSLTQQGYDELKAELADLKTKRSQVIDEVRRAAADKDFRENAPLEAARQQRSHVEGRLRELEETLKSATIIGGKQGVVLKVSIGDTVLLVDSVSGEELRYQIVSSREVDPTKDMISSESPLGKAIIGQLQGNIVAVATPAGALRYQIKQIEH